MAARPKPREALAAEAALRKMREALWSLRHCHGGATRGLKLGLQHARRSKGPDSEEARWAATQLQGARNAASVARDLARSLARSATAVERAAAALQRQVAGRPARR